MILLKYWNEQYKIAMADWQEVYLFPAKIKMIKEVYRGALYYRARGCNKRISYLQLKTGLVKKDMGVINELLPF